MDNKSKALDELTQTTKQGVSKENHPLVTNGQQACNNPFASFYH